MKTPRALQTQTPASPAESRYRRLFETARDGILTLDARTGAITDANPFLLQLSGLSREELIGKTLHEAGLLPDESASAAAFQTLRETGTVRFEVLPWQSARGARPDLEVIAHYDGEGEEALVGCNIRDITERRQSEQRVRFHADLMGVVGQAIIAVDLRGKITVWNPCAEETYGWSHDEAVGRSITSLVLPRSAGKEARVIRRKIAGGERWSQEFEVRRRDGTQFPILMSQAPICDAAGAVVGVVSVSTDITERKRLEIARAQLAAIVESSSDAIFSTDLDGHILTWNRGAQELYGLAPQDALGQGLSLIFGEGGAECAAWVIERIGLGETIENFEMTPPRLAAVTETAPAPTASAPESSASTSPASSAAMQMLQEQTLQAQIKLASSASASSAPAPSASASSGSTQTATAQTATTPTVAAPPRANRRRFPNRDSEARQVSLTISPIFDARGALCGASAIGRDITEQKRAGEASMRNEKLYRALTTNFPNGAVYLMDLEGRFFLAEGRGMAQIGFSPQTFLGKTLREVLDGSSSYRPVRETFEQALLGRETVTEVELNGRFRSVRGVPVLDDEGRVSFVLVMTQDITERKETERALAESEMRLRTLVESLDEVVFEFDLDGTYLNLWTNDEALLIRPKAELIGRRLSDVVEAEKTRQVLDAIGRIAASGAAETLEYQMDTPKGRIWISARLSPIFGADGAVKAVSMLTRDITEKKRIEEALEQTNREILTIWESMSDAFYAVDLDWNITHINAQAAALIQRDAAEIIGRNLWQEFPDAVNLPLHHEFQRAMRDQVPVMFEEYFEPLDMWTEQHAYPSAVGLSVYFRDITDRKRDEGDLRASESRFQSIVANVPGMVYQFVLRPDGTVDFPFVSSGSRELAELEPEAIRENPRLLIDVLHPEDRARYLGSVTKSAASLEPWSWEGRGKLASGKIKWVQGVSRPRQLPDGSTLWDGLLIDVTARREAEDERDRFFTLSPDMLAIAAPDGYFKRLNPAFETVLGFSMAELMARPILDFAHPDDVAATRVASANVRAGRSLKDFVNRYICKNGAVKWLSWHVVPFGDVVYLAAHDITPLVLAESALRRANERLEIRVGERTTELASANEELRVEIMERQMAMAALRDASDAFRRAKDEADAANAAKSEFLSRMSHELRTPLNAILGFGQILLDGSLGSAEQEHVNQILRGGWHLLDLINEVLDISRVEAGHLELSPEPISLAELVAQSCALVQPLAAQRSVQLDASAVERQGGYVLADRQRLKQVLINLLSNGIKYNRRGGKVTISCSLLPDERARIAIEDTGPGLSPEEQAKLFMPFERLRAAESGVEGTGLGLVLSRRLVTAMGGELGVQSAAGLGSTFTLDLPRATAPVAVPLDPDSDEMSLPSSIAAPEKSCRVLCVEDNLPNLQLLSAILMDRPEITLVAASKGQAGLDLARDNHFDLILLDLDLPDISGAEILKQLQASEKHRDTPVVIISADATPPQIKRLLSAGAKNYLTKPIDVRQFLETIDNILLTEPEDGSGDVETEAPAEIAPAEIAPTVSATAARSLRVLVAEDNLVNQRVVLHQLKTLGHRATVYDNGYDIIQAWHEGDFDLILMDCHMPKLDGYATTRAIRQQEAATPANSPGANSLGAVRPIPIVALTANALSGDREKSLAAGMNDHLGKPVKQADLAAALNRWTGNGVVAMPAPPVAAAEIAPPRQASVLQPERWDELQRELGAELLADLVRLFLEEAPRLLDELRDASQAQNVFATQEIAHKFKGSCATLGVTVMAEVCRDIGAQMSAANFEAMPRQLELLAGAFVAAQSEFEEYLAGVGQGTR